MTRGANNCKVFDCVRASEPNDQNDIERASGLSAMAMSRPELAEKRAEVAIPTMTNCSAERESAKVRTDAMSAPMVAATVAPRVPTVAMLSTTAKVAPRAAPAEVPMMDGSASGLFVADCARAPAEPHAAPTKRAVRILGKRISQMMSWPTPVNERSKM